MGAIERWRERRRKRLQERNRLDIMREDGEPFDETKHPRGKGGKFVSKNGGSGSKVVDDKVLKPERHISAQKIAKVESELKRRLVGRKTRSGLEIKKIDPHIVIRAIQRNIWVESIVDAALKGQREKSLDRDGNYAFFYNQMIVGISPDGVLKTAIYYGKDKKGKTKK